MTKPNYSLDFTPFMCLNPTRRQFAVWNRRRMLACIASGDYINAKVYAIELVRWTRRVR